MQNFQKLDYIADIRLLQKQLAENPQLWNEYPERKLGDSPHADMSDIWVRFRPKSELLEPKNYAESHIPTWYPSADILTEAKRIGLDMMTHCRAVQLGGVLITKIPAGGQIKPHHDKGRWHSEFFNTKVYVPIQSNDNCINICEDEKVNMKTGEAWSFDNLKVHSVLNQGEEDRMTLIICLRVD